MDSIVEVWQIALVHRRVGRELFLRKVEGVWLWWALPCGQGQSGGHEQLPDELAVAERAEPPGAA